MHRRTIPLSRPCVCWIQMFLLRSKPYWAAPWWRTTGSDIRATERSRGIWKVCC